MKKIIAIFLISVLCFHVFSINALGKSQISTKSNKISVVKNQSKKLSSKKGQLMDWWKKARYIFKKGTVATIVDVKTGKTFRVIRNLGTNHADCEALTKRDTYIIKKIWGGYNWNIRPIVVVIRGKRIAASMSSMPHAGVDNKPAYAMVSNRSSGYSRGVNLDTVKGNGMNGHFDIHFLNSRTHGTNKIDPRHQAAIRIAAGK